MANPPRSERDSAGVRFPPPILFVIPFLIGLSFDRHLNRWRPPARPAHLIGAVLILAALALFLSAITLFRRHQTTLRTDRKANTLLTEGPYRFTRNPLYTALALLFLGLALLLRAPGALFAWPISIALIQIIVIHREERYLNRRFGDRYRAYRARVRRWL